MNVAIDQPLPIPLNTTPLRVGVLGQDPDTRAGIEDALVASPNFVEVFYASTTDAVDVALGEYAFADAWLWDMGPDFDAEAHWTPPPHVHPVVALVPDAVAAQAALKLGACGALARGADGVAMTAALRSAAAGLTTMDHGFLDAILTETASAPVLVETSPEDRVAADSLTTREREVLELLAEGRSNREVALALDISEHTAKFHIGGILNKLDAATRTEAVVRGLRLGVLVL